MELWEPQFPEEVLQEEFPEDELQDPEAVPTDVLQFVEATDAMEAVVSVINPTDFSV